MEIELVFDDGKKATFCGVTTFKVIEEESTSEEFYATKEASTKQECCAIEFAQTPTEGKLFEVNPQEIDRNLFKRRKKISSCEKVRILIREALDELDKNPEKYSTPFYTLIPDKNWNGYKTITDFEAYASDLGGHVADKIQQALEWAQRISNGEKWENVCLKADPAGWYRIIKWENDSYRRVGGAHNIDCKYSATHISDCNYTSNYWINFTVPLVVIKKK